MKAAWHPEAFARRKDSLVTRQQVIKAIRTFFDSDGFAEVDTPILQVSPGNEVHLQTFSTTLKSYDDDIDDECRYLQTSPEFAMKKLLVAGVPKLYQLAHAFRNKERSSRHHPEFLMLEWYRANVDTRKIQDDCCRLIRSIAKVCQRDILEANGLACDVSKEWEKLTVAEAFRRFANIDLLPTVPDPSNVEVALLAEQARSQNIRVSSTDTWDDIFFRVMGELIEPHLGQGKPTFLCDYPLNQAVLARPKPGHPEVAERFELYMCGIEIANAFGELTDATEQARRFEADMNLREKIYGERSPVDADFLAALAHGMPESAGIALGVDRLVMLMAGAHHIDDVLWLPVN